MLNMSTARYLTLWRASDLSVDMDTIFLGDTFYFYTVARWQLIEVASLLSWLSRHRLSCHRLSRVLFARNPLA